MKDANYWIDALELITYPAGAGGYFRETYRSPDMLAKEGLPERYDGPRSASTLIYFLLRGDQLEPFHRLKSDEMWHFYAGNGLILHVIDPSGDYRVIPLGPEAKAGQQLQFVVSAGSWFGATVVQMGDPAAYALVGCTVSPGFEMEDVEWAGQDSLLSAYPQHEAIITQLT